jgi:hypothetical protein
LTGAHVGTTLMTPPYSGDPPGPYTGENHVHNHVEIHVAGADDPIPDGDDVVGIGSPGRLDIYCPAVLTRDMREAAVNLLTAWFATPAFA